MALRKICIAKYSGKYRDAIQKVTGSTINANDRYATVGEHLVFYTGQFDAQKRTGYRREFKLLRSYFYSDTE